MIKISAENNNTNKIAEILQTSAKTFKVQRHDILHKLGISCAAEHIKYIIKKSLYSALEKTTFSIR